MSHWDKFTLEISRGNPENHILGFCIFVKYIYAWRLLKPTNHMSGNFFLPMRLKRGLSIVQNHIQGWTPLKQVKKCMTSAFMSELAGRRRWNFCDHVVQNICLLIMEVLNP